MTFILSEDAALKTHLSGITVSDAKNNERVVGVWFGQPDLEIREQSYPYMTIDMIDIIEELPRTMRGIIKLPYIPDVPGVDPTKDHYTEYPIPVSIEYQITTYSRHPHHDRQIINAMLNDKTPMRFGNLYVPGNDVFTDTYRRLDLLNFTKRDTVEQNKRLFINMFSVRISSEMYLGQLEEATAEVTDVNTTVNHLVQDSFINL